MKRIKVTLFEEIRNQKQSFYKLRDQNEPGVKDKKKKGY